MDAAGERPAAFQPIKRRSAEPNAAADIWSAQQSVEVGHIDRSNWRLDPGTRRGSAPSTTIIQSHVLCKAYVRRMLLTIAAYGSRSPMICSLQHMQGHHLIEEKDKVLPDGRMRMTYAATTVGYALMRIRK